MSDNVTRLKQLLFDNEAEALADLSRKLDLLQQDRVEANRRFDAVFKRAGTDERLQKSVAGVLDGALRDAEVANHDELADAVAPVVVNTVKTEIRNSRDEIAEALYPMTGRMVKAYIASAMKELVESINRKLDNNPAMLRMRAMTTGRPVSDLVLAESQHVELDQLFLIQRGTGELLARWPVKDVGHNQDQILSGVLTAINDFASEALKDEGSSLREIDLGDRQVYLRASPTYLLAAKCTGSGSVAAEKVLDDAFLSAIDQIHALNDRDEFDSGPETKSKMLALLAGDLQEDLAEAQEMSDPNPEPVATGTSPVTMLVWILGVPLALWMCWLTYENYWRARVGDVAQQIVISSSELKGYPTEVEVSSLGREVTVSGLVPSRYTKSSLVNRLQLALPGTTVNAARLAVVPSGDQAVDEINQLREEIGRFRPDIANLRQGLGAVDGRIALAAVRSNLQRSHRAIQSVLAEMPQLQADISAGNERALVARLKESSEAADRELQAVLKAVHLPTASYADLGGLTSQLTNLQKTVRRRASEMASLLVDPDTIHAARAPIQINEDGLSGVAEVLAVDSAHLASVTVAVAQLAALKARLPKPPPPQKPFELSPHQQLEEFTRRHAVFFSSGTTYRSRQDTSRVLDELAEHMGKTTATLRVVGYTDEKGSSDQNSPLSQSRSNKVTAALVRRGVPRNRLIALGRKEARDISTLTGSRSPNRRVEFEVGFDNEISR